MKKTISCILLLLMSIVLALSASAEDLLQDVYQASFETYTAYAATHSDNTPLAAQHRSSACRIFSSNLEFTLPSSFSLSSSDATHVYYLDSVTSLLIGISKMDTYGTITSWKSTFDKMGLETDYGYINDVLAVTGIEVTDDYSVSLIANNGGISYMLMMRGSYDQAKYFIDILSTLRTTSYSEDVPVPGVTPEITPTTAPTAGPSGSMVVEVLTTGHYVTLPEGSTCTTEEAKVTVWSVPVEGTDPLLVFFTEDLPYDMSNMEDAYIRDGWDVWHHTVNGIPTLQIEKGSYTTAQKYMDVLFNGSSYYYTISAIKMNKDQLMVFRSIIRTLTTDSTATSSPTSSPASTPTSAPTPAPANGLTVEVLDTAHYVTLPSGSACMTEDEMATIWSVPVEGSSALLVFFMEGLPCDMSNMEDTYINKGYDVWHHTVNGIPTAQMEKGSYTTSQKDMDVLFNGSSYYYSISATKMNKDQLIVFRNIISTLTTSAPSVTPTPVPTPTSTQAPTAAPTPTPKPGTYVAVPVHESGLELYLDSSTYLSSSSDNRDYWRDKTNRFSYFIYQNGSHDDLDSAAKFYGNTMDYSIEWYVINGIPGFKATRVNSINTDLHSLYYFFSTGNKIYYISPSSLKTAELADYDKSIRTIHRTSASSEQLTLPASVTTVKSYAFYNTDPYRVVIPYGCTTIEAYAFANNERLTVVEIPITVSSIASTAFSNCSNDLTIVTPASSYASSFAVSKGYIVIEP